VGSIEFAASQFAVRLVVVMGHTKCGAIAATIEELKRPIGTQSRNLRSIVDRIRPWVQTLMETSLVHDHDALLTHSVRANVRASVNHLKHASEVLEDLIDNHGLMVVGAEYSLETGVVEFLDEEYATTPPAGSRE
jgi:carbonic anhydrase